MSSYVEKLKDPRWQKKRLEIIERDHWRCQECHDATKTLHVHHLFYVGHTPWQTPDFALRTLCADCHESASRIVGECDEYFWSACVLMDELRRRDINAGNALDFAYRLNCLTAEEFLEICRFLKFKNHVYVEPEAGTP